MFVRTWLKLKQARVVNASMASLKVWVVTMTKAMVLLASDGAAPTVGGDAVWQLFLDFVQPGGQGKISSKESGQAVIRMTALRKMASMNVRLFAMYTNLVFLDKNPDSEGGDKPLPDEDGWKERVMFDVA